MPEIDQKYIQNKFIEYCKVNTRSDEQSTAVPTTAGQVDLLKIIEKELEKLGLENISVSEEDSYLVGKLKKTTKKEVTPIGFVAHVDTADFNAENVKPLVHQNYDGKDIFLKEQQGAELPDGVLTIQELMECLVPMLQACKEQDG